MLHDILKLKGAQKLAKHSQKEILGGKGKLRECTSQFNCTINQICLNGVCFNCYDPATGSWFC
jgi:hypothetical protein